MAFYLELRSAPSVTWHIDSPLDDISMRLVTVDNVRLLMADGDELDFILKQIIRDRQAIPWSFHICKWRHPWLMFILDNYLFQAERLKGFLPGQPLIPR